MEVRINEYDITWHGVLKNVVGICDCYHESVRVCVGVCFSQTK